MSEEHWRRFIAFAPVAIAMLDRDLRYIAASGRWLREVVHSDEGVLGRLHYDVFPEVPDHWKAVHRRCLAGATEHHDGELFVRADGARQWIRWAVQPWVTAADEVGGLVIFAEDITERKEAEAAVQRSEALLRAVFQSLVEGVVLLDRDGRVIAANDAIRDYGHTFEQLAAGELRRTVVHPDGTPFAPEDLPGAVAVRTGRAVRNVEIGVPLPDGEFRWRLVNAQPVYDAEHKLAGAVTSFFDITERKRVELALRESERRLRLALEASNAATWNWDVATDTLHLDARGCALYGLDPSRLPTFDELAARVHDDDRPWLRERLTRMLRTPGDDEWDVEFRTVRADGTVGWIHACGRIERDAGQRAIYMTGINLDVTARRRTEEGLMRSREEQRESAETMRLLLETAAQGVISVGADGTVLTANGAIETMFGWPAAELIGRPVECLLPAALRERHAGHRADYLGAPRARPMGLGMDLVAQRKDGSPLPVEVSLNRVATPRGLRIIAFVTDITARKRADDALRQSRDALAAQAAELQHRADQLRRLASALTVAEQRAREQLARTLHDGLQQMLFSAALRLQRLDAGAAGDPADARRMLRQTRDDITQAIAASRTLAVELFPPALHAQGPPASLSWLAAWMKEKYGLDVDLSADPSADPVQKDIRTLVFESVRELLFNIVKHAQTDRAAVDIALTPDDAVRVTVIDQGVGFDAEAILGCAATGSGGLGLFSVRERLALFGGRMEAESVPGGVTRVVLSVPRSSG
jgi:PAS domain S-box-containing protein